MPEHPPTKNQPSTLMNEELIAQKVSAGLTRDQAIEVIQRQEAEDAAAAAPAKKSAKKTAKASEDQPPAE